MRIIDCDCGKTLQAANDEELERVVREHFEAEHGGPPDDAALAALLERAYTATDS